MRGRSLARPRLHGPHALSWQLSGRGGQRLLLDAGRDTAGAYLLSKQQARRLEPLRGEPGAAARHALLSFRKHTDGVRPLELVRVPGERQLLLGCGAATLSLRLFGAPSLTLGVGEHAVASLGPGSPAWPPAAASGRAENAEDQVGAPALRLNRPLAELDDADLATAGAARPDRAGDPEGGGVRQEFPSWIEAAACLLELRVRGEAFAAARRDRLAGARREVRRLAALVENLERDLAGLVDAAVLRRAAEALLAAPGTAPAGASEARVPDPYLEGTLLTLRLDPSRDAFGNAEHLFEKARRAARARDQIEARLAQARPAKQAADDRLLAVTGARGRAELPPLGEPRRDPDPADPAAGPRRYLTSHGLFVYVGRGARENQRLTFAFARPEDLWFHARDVPGAHVLLRDDEGRAGELDLREAAELAAFFSGARSERQVDVHVARRKHLRRGRGGPGRVVVAHSETLRVAPRDPLGRLRRR